MTERNESDDEQYDDQRTDTILSATRRGVLAAGAIGLGLAGGAAGVEAENHGQTTSSNKKSSVWADEDDDGLLEPRVHHGIDVETVRAMDVNTTRYADSIEELKAHLDTIGESQNGSGWNGGKIVLTRQEMEASPAQLPIEVHRRVTIEGQGMGPTKIVAEGIDTPVFEADFSTRSLNSDRIQLRNLLLVGNETGGSESVGVYFNNVHTWLIERCEIRGFENGIVAIGSWTGTILNTGSKFNAVDGIRLTQEGSGGRTNNVGIIGSSAGHNGRYGVHLHDLQGVALLQTNTEGNGTYGMFLNNSLGVSIAGCYVEANGAEDDLTAAGIAISPDVRRDLQTGGVSIQGNTFSPFGGSAIKLGEANGVNIAGNRFSSQGSTESYAVELGPNAFMNDIRIAESNMYSNMAQPIRGPPNDDPIDPHALNDGEWVDAVFGGYEGLAALARSTVVDAPENGLTVKLTEQLTRDAGIDGADFPAETWFTGVGSRSVLVESTDAPAVTLARSGQRVSNLAVDATGDTDTAIRIGTSTHQASVEDVFIDESSGDGVSVMGESASVENVVCNSADIAGADITVGGVGNRVLGCNASVDTSNASDAAVGLNVDTSVIGRGSDGTVEAVPDGAFEIHQESRVIDGDVSDLGEPTLTLADDFSLYVDDPERTGSVWLAWDMDNFYFAAAVDDDEHVDSDTGDTIWKNDAFQIAIAPGAPGDTADFAELTVADTGEGPQVKRILQPSKSNPEMVDAAEAAVVVETDGRTSYELAFPWSKLGLEFDPTFDRVLGISIGYHDSDSSDSGGWQNWGGGLFGGKDPFALNLAGLVTDD